MGQRLKHCRNPAAGFITFLRDGSRLMEDAHPSRAECGRTLRSELEMHLRCQECLALALDWLVINGKQKGRAAALFVLSSQVLRINSCGRYLLRRFPDWATVHGRLLRWRGACLLQQLAVGHRHHERGCCVGVRCPFEIESISRLRHANRRNGS